MSMQVKLSTLWIFVMFNYLYADVMALMDPVLLNQFITGNLDGGITMNERFLLYAAFLMEIPIAMVLLSRLLNYAANRWANIIAGTIKTVVMFGSFFVGSGPTEYYLFFGTIEIVCTGYILFIAWNWREDQGSYSLAEA